MDRTVHRKVHRLVVHHKVQSSYLKEKMIGPYDAR